MKKLLKIAALLVAVTMLFTGCGEMTTEDFKGEYKPLDTPFEKYGERYWGGTYTNESLGFKINLPDDAYGNHSVSENGVSFTSAGESQMYNLAVLMGYEGKWWYNLDLDFVNNAIYNLNCEHHGDFLNHITENGSCEIKGEYVKNDFSVLGNTVNASCVDVLYKATNTEMLSVCFSLYENGINSYFILLSPSDDIQELLDALIEKI